MTLGELIRDALEVLTDRVEASLEGVAGGLSAASGHICTSPRGLLTNASRLVSHGARRARGLISCLVLFVCVVASSHGSSLLAGWQKSRPIPDLLAQAEPCCF